MPQAEFISAEDVKSKRAPKRPRRLGMGHGLLHEPGEAEAQGSLYQQLSGPEAAKSVKRCAFGVYPARPETISKASLEEGGGTAQP